VAGLKRQSKFTLNSQRIKDVTERQQTSRRRTWGQYGLRTLFLVVTAACVVLAAADYYVEPWLIDRAAAKAITDAGGSCETVPVGPDFLRTWFGPDVLQRITAVDLSLPESTAACLEHLPRLGHLQKATLAGAKFTDESLTALSRLERLQELTLCGTTVTLDRVAQVRTECPFLRLSLEPLEISFENDLRFDEQKGKPFDRSQLTQRIHCLNGSPVRIHGYMLPGLKHSAVCQFVLA
jgi:hypothetical protein